MEEVGTTVVGPPTNKGAALKEHFFAPLLRMSNSNIGSGEEIYRIDMEI